MEKIKKRFRYDNVGILFVLPAFLYMLVFVGYPIVRNLILSFQDVNAGNLVRGTKNFILFENYRELLGDAVFTASLVNTLRYTVLCLVFQFASDSLWRCFSANGLPWPSRCGGSCWRHG